MVCLSVTGRILNAFEVIPASRREELELPATLELHGPITHEQLLRLSKHLKHETEYDVLHESDGESSTILSFLLRGTKVYVPPPPKKPDPVCTMDIP